MFLPLRWRDDDDGRHVRDDGYAQRPHCGAIMHAVIVRLRRPQQLIDIDSVAEGRTAIGTEQ